MFGLSPTVDVEGHAVVTRIRPATDPVRPARSCGGTSMTEQIATDYVVDDMVGFARAVSDAVGLAQLADVFVLTGHRGRGLGRQLVRAVIEEGPGAGYRWLLHTADGHDFYAEFGFAAPDATLLERRGARPAVLE